MAGPATPEKVRVVVGDDHPLFREGVVRALSSSGSVTVVGEADDGTAALALIKEHRPEVALLDYRMPGMDGGQVAAAVLRQELPTRVLLLSAHDESAIVYQALQQGAAAARMLRELYGLTNAEAQLVQALSCGMTAAAYAESRKVSITTVYTHLRRTREKTGWKSVAELTRRFHALNVALRPN